MKMREAGSLHDRVIDRNWVLKRKRKRVSCRSDLVKREGSSLPTESPRNYTSVKQKLKGEISSSRNSHKIKGHDGYYFECVECDLGGNLLCCDSCPRTYHLECLNPPLKRTPPGKWHCPCCRGQKDPLKLSKTADMSSRKARRKNMSEQLNSVNRSSRSDFASLAENNSSHECKFTNRSQTTASYRGSSIEKKPDVSEADTSCNTKSSQFSEGGLINGNLTQAQDKVEDESGSFDDSKNCSNKETHSSIRTLDAGKISSEAKTDEMQQKKLVIHLERLVEKSKKKKQKFNRRDKKKRPAGKGQVVPLPELANSQMFKEASPRSEPRRPLQKRKSISQQNSWSVVPKRSKIQKLSRRKQPERSPEEASPSSGQCHEQELEADKSIQCHDNLLDGTQQVDRILGCRMQSTDAVLAYSPRVKFSSHNCVKSGSNLGELANGLSPCNTNPDVQGILSKEPHDDSKNSDTMVVDTLHAEGCCSKTEGNDYNGNICDNSVGGEGSDAKRVSDTRCAPESGIMEKSIESPKDPCLTMKNSEIIDKSVVNLVDDKEKPEKESLEVDTGIELAVTSSHSHCIKEDHSHVSFRCDSEDVPHTTLDAQPDGSVVNHLLASTTQDFKAMEKDKLEYEFLVKWMGQSNIHNSWVSESQLKILAKRKLENYKAKYGTALINICGEQWSIPQRVISLRASKDGNNDEALVKWSGLPYDECTWEKLEEPVIRKFAHLIDELKKFELQAMEKDVVDDVSSAEDDLRELVPLGDQPKELRGGSLFPHQLEALNWLRKCWHKSKNVILADEMGLGKTVSACAFISSLYVEFKVKLPCLVLVPLSTMPNWMSEFASWTPHLNVVEYHGSAKARAIIRQYEWRVCDSCGVHKRDAPYKFNVLLTTYEMVLADSSHLRGVPWEVLVVDEGHRLKNSSSKLFGLLNSFSFQHRVLLTGTPLQNNIGEMYNLLNFLQPASFPSLSAFEEKFNDLTNTEKVEELKKLVAPHMLRRLKKDAMQNIPPKTERIVPVELSSIQAEYYRAMLTKNYQILRNIGKGGVHQSLLNIVMQLRKVCNHPYLISGTEPESGTVDFLQEMRIKASGKLTLLHSMLKILNKEGHRVLIFSQMTKLLDILEDYLTIEYGPKTFERVDGSVLVADRQAAIARFNQDKSRFVFLLSTRSCGLGINLATADTVIIYDSDFNPHADIQAMNRAHRIGQSNRLLVYRLVVRASVEERILQLAKKKLMLDQLFVNKSESQKEVEDIIRWGTEELFRECNDVAGKDTKESSTGIVETLADGELKHRRRGGGLGDVYQDKCTDGSSKIVWDDNAIIKLLDRDNLHSPVPESTDGDLENDLLGSVKSPEWNDDSNEDLGGTEPFPTIIGDGSDQATEVKEDNVPSVAEENEWDRLLRLRWEKYQIEEEAALGRGKRLRKAVSYKETFANTQSEALSESANEDEEPEPEYTATGRALKEKYAKLRARQKERLARRHMMEADFPTGRPDLHLHPLIPTCKETESSQKMVDEALAQVPQINAGDTIVSEDKDRMAWQGRSSKHGVKRLHSSHLDLPDRPPESACPDTLIASHQFKNRKYPNLLPGSNHLPVLGLCAPNASQADSSSRKFQSFLSLQPSNHEHRRASIEMPDFPFPTASGSGPLCPTIKDAQTTVGMPLHPETSGEALHQRPKDLIPDSYLPFFHGPPTTSKGSHEEPLDCSSFAAFQEKMALPSLGLHERPLPKFPLLSMNSARPLHMDLFPNLSLSTNLDHASASIEDHPNIPLVPTFRQQMNESLKLKQQMVELPPLFGLGSMHASQYSLPENHKRVLDSIIMRTGTARSKFSKKRVKVDAWTEDELDALWIGVRRHGRGNWDAMLRDPKLKFSKHKTSGDLSMRWAEEQLKVLDGAPMTASRSLRASFPGISDGMMTRALLGSKFANLGTEQPMFRSHLTDIQLGCRDLASSFPPIDPRNQFGTINDSFPPLPLWLTDKMKSSLSADFDVGPSDRPGNLNLPMDQPFELNPLSVGKNFESPSINHSASCDTQKTEDQPCTNKYLKLPNFLDRSFDPILDRHNNVPVGEAIAGRPPDMQNKQNSNNSPINNDTGCGSSSTNKLPHWLRDAVSLPPTKPPEPVLPPTVSAIAQSVRLLYGEEKRTIPPFKIPGPPLFQPTDPRKHLKRKRKSHKLRQATLEILIGNKSSEVASLSSTPPAPNASTSNVPSVGPIPSLPSLSLDLNSPSSSSFASQEKKSSTMLSPSPDVLQFASSSEVPQTCGSPTHIPSTTCQANEMPSTKDVETSEPAGNGMNEDLMGFSGRLTESENLLVESWEIITKDEIQQSESGDSRKTKSNTCKGDQDKSEEMSSEETESVNHQSHHDS